jgi:hypothetical protein
MTSWREQASQTAQDDFDSLINDTLIFARQQLDHEGGFFPFGAVVTSDGERAGFAVDAGSEHPTTAEVLELLWAGIASERASFRAVAVASDVKIRREPDTDAVRVELEHVEGVCIQVMLPFAKRRFGRGIQFDALEAAAGDPWVWRSA